MHPADARFEDTYRRLYAANGDEFASKDEACYQAWMRTNKLAFHAINPNLLPHEVEAAFLMFMFETYEGQLPLA